MLLPGVLVQRFALQATTRMQQQGLKESKPKAKAKGKAQAKGKAKAKPGRKPKSSPDTPKKSKDAKGKERQTKKKAQKVEEVVTPKASRKRKGKENSKTESGEKKTKTPMKRPSRRVSGPKTKDKGPTAPLGQAVIVNPSNPCKRTFARRAEPKNEVSKAWWASLYQAFDQKVKPRVKFASTLEDWVGVVIFQQVWHWLGAMFFAAGVGLSNHTSFCEETILKDVLC